MRRKQVYFSDRVEGASWVIQQFRWKTEEQLKVLQAFSDRMPKQKQVLLATIQHLNKGLQALPEKIQIPDSRWSAALRGWEGQMARQYWQAIGMLVPPQWRFSQRSRRPALDAYNALTNYCYGMLYTLVEQALFAAGLDPHLGILHSDQYDRPTLAYDLIEAFRPWVDHLILEWCYSEMVEVDFFEATEAGILLNSLGKARLIPLYNDWLEEKRRWQGHQLSRRAHVYRTGMELAQLIRERISWPDEEAQLGGG